MTMSQQNKEVVYACATGLVMGVILALAYIIGSGGF